MLKRKIEAEIKTWYDIKPKHNALLVMGARQVGKTFSIRRFAEKHYASVIEINFERTPRCDRCSTAILTGERCTSGSVRDWGH